MSDYRKFLDFISSKECRYPQYICNTFASPNALAMMAFCNDGVVKKTQGTITNEKIISQNVEKYSSLGINVSYSPFSDNVYTLFFGGLTLIFSNSGQIKIYTKPGETLYCVGANSIGPTNNETMERFVLLSPLFDPTMQNTTFRSVSLWVLFVIIVVLFIIAILHITLNILTN
jgi:hypothetical protein